MTNEVVVVGDEQHPLTANAVVARVRLIQDVMAKVMKKDTHYGIIPGCQKPSLYKTGAEQLLVTFRIAPDEPKVDDLSTGDSIRYRVTRVGKANGATVAAGIGECSSDEEKFKWRSPVCDAEYDATPEDRKRLKWKRDGTSYKQVRTNPADVANTILKIADKRAFVAMALLATAASDLFVQDLEDMPEEVVASVVGADRARPTLKEPQAKPAPAGNSVTFIPAAVSVKDGEKDGKAWKKYGVKHPDGSWYGTFDTEIGQAAQLAAESKEPITITFKDDGKYKTITELKG